MLCSTAAQVEETVSSADVSFPAAQPLNDMYNTVYALLSEAGCLAYARCGLPLLALDELGSGISRPGAEHSATGAMSSAASASEERDIFSSFSSAGRGRGRGGSTASRAPAPASAQASGGGDEPDIFSSFSSAGRGRGRGGARPPPPPASSGGDDGGDVFASFSSVRGGRGRGGTVSSAGPRRVDAPAASSSQASSLAVPRIERSGAGVRGIGAAFTAYQLVCQLVLGALLSAEDRVEAASQLWHEWVWEDVSDLLHSRKARRSSIDGASAPVVHEPKSLSNVCYCVPSFHACSLVYRCVPIFWTHRTKFYCAL